MPVDGSRIAYGNRIWSAANAVTNSYTVNSLNQYTTILRDSPPPREILHDADGNMTQCGDWSFTYDADNRLTSVSSNGIILIINQYDHKGRRIRKTTPTSETTFLYDGWNLIYEREIAGAVTNETYYYWGKDLSGTLQGAGGVGGFLYLKRNGTIYIPHRDANGNIVRYTDAAGNVVVSYTYGAFCNTLSAIGALADVFRFRFSTKYYDPETGLYYYGYRFYSPSLMRWLNRDPIEEAGGNNLYAFCANNPMIRYDSYGQSWLECFGDCVEEWRLDWGQIFTALNAASSLNMPVAKTAAERRWIDNGVSDKTTKLSRAISQGEHLARKLPLGNSVRSRLMQSLGNLRRSLRRPSLIKVGYAGAALTIFEGFYDIGVMTYCSMHCCGDDK